MFGEFVTKSLSTVSVVIGSNYYCNTCSRCNCFCNDFVNVTFLCNYPKIASLRLVCQNMGGLQLNQLSCNFVRIMWFSILKCWNKQQHQHNINLTLPFKLCFNQWSGHCLLNKFSNLKSFSKLLYPIYFFTSNYVGFTISLIPVNTWFF
jgi:hypothetical protein